MAMHPMCYIGQHNMQPIGMLGEAQAFVLMECTRCHVRKAEKV